MKLPVHLENANEWLLVGPMGPTVPAKFNKLPIFAVDGGHQHCSHFDLWLGDGDSGETPPESSIVFSFPQDKDRSDLCLSLNCFASKKGLLLHFWGFLGGRRDHEWITIGETLSFLEKSSDSKVIFYNSKGEIELYCLSSGIWNFHHLGLFSLATHKAGKIKITGESKYALSEWTDLPALSSHGLSNIGHGEFQIACTTPTILFLIQDEQ